MTTILENGYDVITSPPFVLLKSRQFGSQYAMDNDIKRLRKISK